MSYKLVDQIIRKSRAASGSAKAILIAMATYAEDDGTNVFPAMNNLADDAGVGERTAYRAVDELLELGLINDTGNKHHWGRGHYTVEYVINLNPPTVCEIDSLSNRQWQSAKLTNPPCQNGTQLNPITQSLESVKEMNEGTKERRMTAASPPTDMPSASLEPKTQPLPESWSQLIIDLCPQALDNPKVMRREGKACNQLLDLNWEPETVREFWAWNMKHKSGKWRFTSLATLLKSVTSDSEKSGYSMFLSCQSSPCRICKPKESSAKEKVEHSHGCYNNPCYCYLSLGPENQEYWRTLVKYNLCGHVGNKWYLGKSAEEAIAGYPFIDACISDLFGKQPPDLIAKLSVLIQESAARKPQTEVKADEYVRYMSGLDEPERAAFEIEEDLG